MANVKFELNRDGVRELLQSAQMQSILSGYGQQKAQQAGAGYASKVRVHKRRAVAYVYPETSEATHDNYENNTLLKVVR